MPVRRLTLLLTLAAMALAVATSSAAAAGFSGWSPSSGTDPVATITGLDTSSDALTGGGDDSVSLSLTSVVAQHLRITVLGATGRTIRTIVDTDVQAGPGTWSWNGTDAGGAAVADGTYELVVEAGTSADSMSISDVVRVDRRASTIYTPVRRVRVNRASTSFALPIVSSERTMLEVVVAGATGRARTTSSRAAGRSKLVVPIVNRRSLRSRGAKRVTVRIVATDSAGNRSARNVAVLLQPDAMVDTGGGSGPGIGIGSVHLSWPLSGPITSGFGNRWGRHHDGIDLGVPTGRPIGAAAAGRVTYASWMSGYGNCTIIDHGGGVSTLYGHQSKLKVHVGQSVSRGQVIGLVGSTGNSTGPHLHFEVRIGGTAHNPLTYLP
jgi:murein DD-endopeptidase MepM/ murein hydrolase activator NlpD